MTNKIRLCMAFFMAFITSLCVQAQVTIGADKLPETFSVLQLESKYGSNQYGGLRMPRLSIQERNQLLAGTTDKTEAAGLMIYNTSKKCMEYWNGKQWLSDNNCCPNTVTDIEGNSYTVGQFGDAGCWMTQNLRVTKYADNSPIIQNGNAGTDPTLKYYTYPNNNATVYSNNPEYGLLYTWAAATNGDKTDSFGSGGAGAVNSNLQGVCPEGWVLPSDKDWNELEKEITNHASKYSSVADGSWNSTSESATGWRGSKHGRAMKSQTAVNGTASGGSSNASDANGFSALLVGHVYQGSPGYYGTLTYFWSSSEGSSTTAWYRALVSGSEQVFRGAYYKYHFFSVRCKKK